MSLIMPVKSHVISLSEAAGFGPETPKTWTRDAWKQCLRRHGMFTDLDRMEDAEERRARRAKKRKRAS